MGKVKKIAIHNTVYTLEGDEASIIANHAIPNTWHTSGTMVQLISDINNDETATEGKSYTGTVSLSDLPASMAQAEMKVEITKGSTSGNKIILFTITSENTAPYHWERVSAYGRAGYWREFMPNKNIDSTPTNGSNNLVTSDGVYDAVSTKVTGTGIKNIVKLTKTEYDALVTKDSNTVYLVDYSPVSFAGLEICPAPLYYGANGFEIKDSDWDHTSYQQHYGKVEGSYLFTFIELGSYFDSDGDSFSNQSESIDNVNTIDGWRVPTSDEFGSVLTTDINVRPGSTVNGVSGKHYSMISFSSTRKGLLIYPDGFSYKLPELTNFDSTTANTLTINQINALVSSGCVFLPKMGRYANSGWYNWGVYWYATDQDHSNNTGRAKCLYFDSTMNVQDTEDKTGCYDSVRLVRTIQVSQQVCKLYLGSILIADPNTTNDIASILATI